MPLCARNAKGNLREELKPFKTEEEKQQPVGDPKSCSSQVMALDLQAEDMQQHKRRRAAV